MAHFLKHLTEDTMTLKKLLVPSEFVSKCGRVNLTNPVVLEPSIGDSRQVELYEDRSGFWLRNGWPEFVDEYKLSHGDYLLFEYKSYSKFKLVMFGANGLDLMSPIPKMARFLKHLTEETITVKKLLIPAVFVSKCGRSNLTNPLVLEPAVGDPLEVELYEDNSGFWMRNGWKELADQYSLKDGHYLVFEYKSYSRFKLVMLGANGLELEFPASSFVNVGSNGNQEIPDFPEAEEEEKTVHTVSVEFIGTSRVKDTNNSNNNGGGGRRQAQLQSGKRRQTHAGGKRKANWEASQRNRGNGSPFGRDEAENSYIPSMEENRKVNQEAPRTCRGNGSPFGSDNAETSRIPSMAEQEASKRPSSSRRGRPTAKTGDGSNSQPDFLRVIVSKSSLSRNGLDMRRVFVERHITDWNGKIVDLRVEEEEETWPVRIMTHHGMPVLSKGWWAFARHNSLKAGDTLIFVPTNTEDLLSVHVLRCIPARAAC